jgi:hypothetical protein
MPFILRWTERAAAQELQFTAPGEALAKYEELSDRDITPKVQDESGKLITYNDLVDVVSLASWTKSKRRNDLEARQARRLSILGTRLVSSIMSP